MNTGSWVLLMLAAVTAVGYGGYLLGRRNSAQQQEIDRLEQDLDAARQRADQIKAGVSTHFEQSAVIFGQLAKDYRQFLDHFQSSAKELGLSDARAGELLDQVARPLLDHRQQSPAATTADAVSPPLSPESDAAEARRASSQERPAASGEASEGPAESGDGGDAQGSDQAIGDAREATPDQEQASAGARAGGDPPAAGDKPT